MVNKSYLDKLFYPKSIAVLGASNDLEKIGGYIFSELKRFVKRVSKKKVDIFPINLKTKRVQGVKAYKSIVDLKSVIKKSIDLLIIAVPRDFVLKNVEEAVKCNVKNLIIITAGFKESDDKGKELENRISFIAKKYKINIVGPNCLGILNPEISLNCSFAKDIPNPGKIAFISQSGAVIDGIVDWSFKEENVGFSKIVSIGNMSDLSILDLLEYLENDKKTEEIVLYLETVPNGKRFSRMIKRISKKKPVIVLKPGNSENAKRAISSHTGSLAKDGRLVKKLIEESNGIYVEGFNDLFLLLRNISVLRTDIGCSQIKDMDKVLIVTNAGGPGVIATDYLDKTELKLYQISNSLKDKLLRNLPKEASLNNPIDILGDAKSDRYESVLNLVLKEKNIYNILVLLTPQIMTDIDKISEIIVKLSKKYKRDIFVSYIGDYEINKGRSILRNEMIPYFETPEDALRFMNFKYKYAFKYSEKRLKLDVNIQKVKKVREKIKELFNEEGYSGIVPSNLVKEVFSSLNIPYFQKVVLSSIDDINRFINSKRFLNFSDESRFVVKGEHPKLLHKKDVGAVVVGLSKDDLKKSLKHMYDKLSKVYPDIKLSIEREVSGTELFVGLKNDKDLGSFIFFGTGGIYANLYNDIDLSTAPLTVDRAVRLIKNTKICKILEGYRGSEKINLSKLIELLIRISYISKFYPEVKEIDFNPIICKRSKFYLVDVKIVI